MHYLTLITAEIPHLEEDEYTNNAIKEQIALLENDPKSDNHTSNLMNQYLISQYKSKINTSNTGNIANVGNKVLSTIRVIGMILSVGVLMILGIKYMLGSSEEKAEYKKTMIPYVIGAVLIFAGTFIVSAIYEFASK